MRLAMKKLLSAIFLLFIGFFQFGLLSLARPAVADQSLIDGQEGFKSGEVSSAFGGKEKPDDIRYIVVRIINVVLSVLSVIFLALVLIAGFKYMTAAGNEDKVKDAVKQITQAVIGLVIILMSWGISYFILVRMKAIAEGKVNYLQPPW